MKVRSMTASIVTLALVAGFMLGRATGPHAVAVAQPGPMLSHFMCYQTQFATSAVAQAEVQDQFGQTNLQFYRANMFCAPAIKKPINFKPLKVPGNADHLMCYRTQSKPINASRTVVNQLEKTAFRGLTPAYFCLPTWKAPG